MNDLPLRRLGVLEGGVPPATAAAFTAAFPEAPRSDARAGPQGWGESQSVYHKDIDSILHHKVGKLPPCSFWANVKVWN